MAQRQIEENEFSDVNPLVADSNLHQPLEQQTQKTLWNELVGRTYPQESPVSKAELEQFWDRFTQTELGALVKMGVAGISHIADGVQANVGRVIGVDFSQERHEVAGLTQQAVQAAEINKMQQAIMLLQESFNKLRGMIEIAKKEKILKEKKEEELKKAVRSSFKDYGTTNCGRVVILNSALDIYLDNYDFFNTPEMAKLKGEIAGLIVRLGKEAEEGADFKEETMKEFEELKKQIEPKLQDIHGQMASAAGKWLENSFQMLSQKNISGEYEKAVMKVRKYADEFIDGIGKGIAGQEFKKLQKRIDYATSSFLSLEGIANKKIRKTVSEILARGLDALEMGEDEVAELQQILSSEYVIAKSKNKGEIEELSKKLSKETLIETLKGLGSYLSGLLKREIKKVDDKEIAEELEKIKRRVEGEPSPENFEYGREAIDLADEYLEDMKDLEGHKEVKEGVLDIYKRAFRLLGKNGNLKYVNWQKKLAKFYVKKRMKGARGAIGALSQKIEDLNALKEMHRLIKEGKTFEEAAALISPEKASEYAIMYSELGDEIEKTLTDMEGQIEFYLNALETRNGFAKLMKDYPEGMIEAAISWMDTHILMGMEEGRALSEEELRIFFGIVGLIRGSTDHIAVALGRDNEGSQKIQQDLFGLDTFLNLVSRLRGTEKEDAMDIFWMAQEKIMDGDAYSAVALIAAANAIPGLEPKDRKLISSMATGVAYGGVEYEKESPEDLLWISKTQRERAKNKSRDKNADAYFDLAIMAFQNKDQVGADIIRDLAVLYSRATEVQGGEDAIALVQSILGDHSRAEKRVIDGSYEGIAGIAGSSLLKGETFVDGLTKADIPVLQDYEEKAIALALIIKRHEVGLDSLVHTEKASEIKDEKHVKTYLRQTHRAEKKAENAGGDAFKKEYYTAEAERISYSKMEERIKKSEQLHDYGTNLQLTAIDKYLESLRDGTIVDVSAIFEEGQQLAMLSSAALDALSILHESIVDVRTDKRERGRLELQMAADSYLQLAHDLQFSDEASLSDGQLGTLVIADRNAQIGEFEVSRQKMIWRELKKIEKNLLAEVEKLREANEDNRKEYKDENGEMKNKHYVEYKFNGETHHRGVYGREVVKYEQREEDLKVAEKAAQSHDFEKSSEYLERAGIGVHIDGLRGETEKMYRYLLDGLPKNKWAPPDMNEMKEFNYQELVGLLYIADDFLKIGENEKAKLSIDGFADRLTEDFLVQDIYNKELALHSYAEAVDSIAMTAIGFGFDLSDKELRRMVKDDDFTYDDFHEQAYETIEDEQVRQNLKAVKGFIKMSNVSKKGWELRDQIIEVAYEHEILRDEIRSGRLDKTEERDLVSSFVDKKREEMVGRFQDFYIGSQLTISLASESLRILDAVDSAEKSRGYDLSDKQEYERIRDEVGILLQLANNIAKDPEKVPDYITGRTSIVGSRDFFALEHVIREGGDGYQRAVIEFKKEGDGKWPDLLEDCLENIFHCFEDLGESNMGGKDVSKKLAGTYVKSLLAGLGYGKDKNKSRYGRLNLTEGMLKLLQKMGGEGGIADITGDFLRVPSQLTSYFSTEEASNMFDALYTQIDVIDDSVSEVVTAASSGSALDSPKLKEIEDRVLESRSEQAKEYHDFLKEGREAESYARGAKIVFDMILGWGMSLSLYGSAAGIYMGTMALRDLSESSYKAGGFDNLKTSEKVLGLSSVVLGYATAGVLYLGEAAAANKLTGTFGKTLAAFGEGGKGVTLAGRVMLGAGAIQAAMQLPTLVKLWQKGEMTNFEFFANMFSMATPLAQWGPAALGPKMQQKLLTGTGIGSKTFNVGMTLITGKTKAQMRFMDFGTSQQKFYKVHKDLTPVEKGTYENFRAEIEISMGRSLDADEKLFIVKGMKDGMEIPEVWVALEAKPRIEMLTNAHKQLLEGDTVGWASKDDLEFLRSVKDPDIEITEYAYGQVSSESLERAVSFESASSIRGGRITELYEAYEFFRSGELNETRQTRLRIGNKEIALFSELGNMLPGDAAKKLSDHAFAEDVENRNIRYLEDEQGAEYGSRQLEFEIGKCSIEVKKVARLIEEMIGGHLSQQQVNDFIEKYPEYGTAIETAGKAEIEERPFVIRELAEAIVYQRKAQEIETAIEIMESDRLSESAAGDVAEVARNIHKSIYNQPVEPNVDYLDADIPIKVEEKMEQGMEEADAIVEVAKEIIEGQEQTNIVSEAEIDIRRVGKEADELDRQQTPQAEEAEVINLDDYRNRGPDDNPDGPTPEEVALEATGTDDGYMEKLPEPAEIPAENSGSNVIELSGTDETGNGQPDVQLTVDSGSTESSAVIPKDVEEIILKRNVEIGKSEDGKYHEFVFKEGDKEGHIKIEKTITGEELVAKLDEEIFSLRVEWKEEELKKMGKPEGIEPDAIDERALRYIEEGGTIEQAAQLDILSRSDFIPAELDTLNLDSPKIKDFHENMLNFIWSNPESFIPAELIKIDGQMVMVGRPMKVGNEVIFPIYVTSEKGRRNLVIAYHSESQDCWRRFAGGFEVNSYREGENGLERITGFDIKYYKGNLIPENGTTDSSAEHFQDFHWKIQKVLDGRMDATTSLPVANGIKSLNDIGIYDKNIVVRSKIKKADYEKNKDYVKEVIKELCAAVVERSNVVKIEHYYQKMMRWEVEEMEPTGENRPHKLIDMWESGDDKSAYGNHINLVIASENEKYHYVIALTEDGIFPKYIQDAETGGITNCGSPNKGVLLKDEGLLLPLMEYAKQVTDDQTWRYKAMKTIGWRRIGRIRFLIGMHSLEDSPLYNLDNAFAKFYPMLREGKVQDVMTELHRMMVDEEPLAVDARLDVITIESAAYADNERVAVLELAFQDYLKGELDTKTDAGKAKAAEYGLSERDLEAFGRIRAEIHRAYIEHRDLSLGSMAEMESMLQGYLVGNYEDNATVGNIMEIINAELRLMAFVWTRDNAQLKMNAGNHNALAETLYEGAISIIVKRLVDSYDRKEVTNSYASVFAMQRQRMRDIMLADPSISPEQAARDAIADVNAAMNSYRAIEEFNKIPEGYEVSSAYPRSFGDMDVFEDIMWEIAGHGRKYSAYSASEVYKICLDFVVKRKESGEAVPLSEDVRQALELHRILDENPDMGVEEALTKIGGAEE
jgi:hypothetical protein